MTVFPPLTLFIIYIFFGFVALPIIISLAMTALIFYLLNFHGNFVYHRFYPLIVNFVFLVIFLITSEIYLQYQVTKALKKEEPNCFIKKSFIKSLLYMERGYRHTVYVKDGYVFRWSFRENEKYCRIIT